jgi:UDP-N-acetylmuramate dehydrogenase
VIPNKNVPRKKKAMDIQRGEALRRYNTLALQARAEAFVSVRNDAELLVALAWARAQELPVIPLGEGSNVVFAGDIHALLIRQETQGIEILDAADESVRLRVSAGENWHQLVRWTIENGLFGLQNLALIPGTAGAAPIQNIGAYGVELKSTLLQVHARQIVDDQPVTFSNKDCEFGYRDSVFKRRLKDQLVITAIDLQLSRHPDVNIAYPALASYFQEHAEIAPSPHTVFEAVVSIRKSKLPDPSSTPNAGSFFKNPVLQHSVYITLLEHFPELPGFVQSDDSVKVPAAWLIDYCGWKGCRRDNLGVHEQHALVLVNYGSDSGRQLLTLADEITASVERIFGVRLEIEPRVYGATK